MKLYNQYKEKGLEIIGLALGAPPDMVSLFIEEKGVNYPNFLAEGDVLDAYSLKAVPFNVFFGRDGSERKRELGYNEEKKNEMEEEVKRLLKE